MSRIAVGHGERVAQGEVIGARPACRPARTAMARREERCGRGERTAANERRMPPQG